MSKIIKSFLGLLVAFVVVSGCKKSDPYNAEEQLRKEDEIIQQYLKANNITAQKHESGVYYVIGDAGSGSINYTASTKVQVKYDLKILGGQTIPQTTDPVTFTLGNVIVGWQIGVPLINKGGSIKLFVPSVYAYGQYAQNGIPANSILEFNIQLLDVGF